MNDRALIQMIRSNELLALALSLARALSSDAKHEADFMVLPSLMDACGCVGSVFSIPLLLNGLLNGSVWYVMAGAVMAGVSVTLLLLVRVSTIATRMIDNALSRIAATQQAQRLRTQHQQDERDLQAVIDGRRVS